MAGASVQIAGQTISTRGGEFNAPMVMLYALPSQQRRPRARRPLGGGMDSEHTAQAETGDIDAADAVVVASTSFSARTGGTLWTDGATIVSAQLDLSAFQLSNRGGLQRRPEA
jgi:hypothetical protein